MCGPVRRAKPPRNVSGKNVFNEHAGRSPGGASSGLLSGSDRVSGRSRLRVSAAYEVHVGTCRQRSVRAKVSVGFFGEAPFSEA